MLTASVSFAETPMFTGPSISNGPVGKELISCNGKTKDGVEAVVNVQVVLGSLGSGIVLRFQLQGKPFSENLVAERVTPFGSGYVGRPLSVIVPNIQGPATDTYQVIVYENNNVLAIINCRR